MHPDHHHSHRHGDRLPDGRPHGQRRHHPDARTDGPGGHRTRGGRPHGPGRGRAQRGDVRTALLLLLAEEPRDCYQLMQEIEERIYEVQHLARLRIENGQQVSAGDFLTEGSANPQDILRISGREAVHKYMVNEVQKVYRSQGVTINDKHIEIIVRQMLQKVRITDPGDTTFLHGEDVDKKLFHEQNRKTIEEGGKPAVGAPSLPRS